MRDFMASRRVGGRQQIKTAITFHTAGEQILWPYGYTKTDVPCGHDHGRPRGARRDRQEDGRDATATRAMQSSSLYVTDGDEIDWAYGSAAHLHVHVRAVPEPQPRSARPRASTRPTSSSAARPSATRRRSCTSSSAAGCRVRAHRQDEDATAARCSTTSRRYGGWNVDPLGTDTATAGAWQRGEPGGDRAARPGRVPSGSRALVTGAAAGIERRAPTTSTAASRRSARAPVALPATVGSLTFRYYLAHSSNSSSADYFRAYVERRGRHPDAGPPGARRGEHRPARPGRRSRSR